MNQRERNDLDRYITGNYGEDQFREDDADQISPGSHLDDFGQDSSGGGFAICLGSCINCGKPFSFNPVKVPSIRVNGVREPVCKPCVETANVERVAAGLEPFAINPDAYDPCREEELG